MKILIVCRGNTCRSPMYAALLQDKLKRQGREATVESAGILASAKGQPAAREWLEMRSYTHVDLNEHRSRWIGDLDLNVFDTIICLDEDAFAEVGRLRFATGTFVYVLNGEYYLRTAVKTGVRSGEFIEISDGLYPGDVVVATAVEQLWLTELRVTKGGGHSH